MRRKDREVTEISEITNILDMCKTACVAMADKGAPYVVPLSYGYEWRDNCLVLYFHCAKEGKKIELLKDCKKVCFTIFNEGEPLYAEIPCSSGYSFSSIIGKGVVEFIDNPEEKSYALQKLFAHQFGKTVEFTETQSASVCVFKISSKDYTGKRKQR